MVHTVQFQLRSTLMIYVGIDVAKSKHDCVIIDDNAQILEAVFTIANSNNGF